MSRIGTIGGNVDSPQSTIGISSAAPASTRMSPHRSVAMQSVERSDGPVFPYGPSLAGGEQSPAVLGGASMPPPSPCRQQNFPVGAVGIPTSQQPRKINNIDENKWEEGYDSDGEIGPFLDAVEDQGGVDVEGEDDELPNSMVAGGGSGNTTTIKWGALHWQLHVVCVLQRGPRGLVLIAGLEVFCLNSLTESVYNVALQSLAFFFWFPHKFNFRHLSHGRTYLALQAVFGYFYYLHYTISLA